MRQELPGNSCRRTGSKPSVRSVAVPTERNGRCGQDTAARALDTVGSDDDPLRVEQTVAGANSDVFCARQIVADWL